MLIVITVFLRRQGAGETPTGAESLGADDPFYEWFKYSTFWARFGAAFIDGIVLLPVLFVLEAVALEQDSLRLLLLAKVVHLWASFAYSILLHGQFGQTVGKMVTRVKVLDVTEKPLGMWRAFLRDSIPLALCCISLGLQIPVFLKGTEEAFVGLVQTVPYILFSAVSFLWFLAEMVTMLFNRKRRAVHDLVAGSVVIRLPKGSV